MSRSPLAYPLIRSADTDVGGAADLQTDIMRFMAILSLCLVAIFALVQSIPLTPVERETTEPPPVTIVESPPAPPAAEPIVQAQPAERVEDELPATAPRQAVMLTRPKWVPRYPAQTGDAAELRSAVQVEAAPVPVAEPAPVSEPAGFTLRFESDAALTRAVAASHVGVYAIADSKAQRMTVSESRISFWAASTPNTFHEMEAATVPQAVVDALARSGVNTNTVRWGVTLPGKMKSRLDALMEAHDGGSLIIGAGGDIRWEDS